MRLLLILVVLVTLAAVALPVSARAGDVRLVGRGVYFALIDGSSVRVFLADGRLLLRLPPARDRGLPEAAASAEQVRERREQIFELFDVPTELRDTQEAEDLVEEELTLGERPTPLYEGPAAEPSDAIAAADAGGLWLGVAGNLYRVGPALESARVGPLAGSVRALVAGDDGTLVVATATELLASTDGGKSVRPLLRVPRPPTHLAVDPAIGWLAWADAAGVNVIRSGSRRSVLNGPVRDLQSCAGQLVALADDGIHVLRAEGARQRISGPVPGRQLVCPRAGPGPWLLAGEGLMMSADQGRTFRARADAPPGLITSAAFTRDRIWLFSAAVGLTSLPFEEQAAPHTAPTPAAAPDPLPEISRPRWTSLLFPRLTLATSYAESRRRRDLRALAIAELPLGGPDPRVRYPRPLASPILAVAQPGVAEPLVAQPPASVYPAPYPSPYPPRDPDTPCLAAARLRAVARAQAEPERARSLVVRAGRAAWLPELRLMADKRLGRSESLDLRSGSSAAARDALGLDVSDDVRYEVRATWDLPRLVFSPEEVAAVQQALRIADMRREIEAQVNRIYFERRRLLVNPAGAPPAEATGALLRVEELEAELDALSGGEFSRCRATGPSLSGP